MFSTSRFLSRGNGRTRGPSVDPDARQGRVTTLRASLDASARITAVERPDGDLRRLLPDLRLGCSLTTALRGLDEALADGLQEAADRGLTVAGRALGGSARAPLVIEYDLRPSPTGAGTDLTLWAGPTAPAELAALCLSTAQRARAQAQILALANRGADAGHAARAALPLLVSASAVTCAAIYTVEHGSVATLLAAFGPTRRRGFPYPALDLGVTSLASLLLRPGVLVYSDAHTEELPAGLLDVCPSRCGLVALAPCFAGHALTGVLVVSRTSPEPPSVDDCAVVSSTADALGLSLGNSALSQESHLSEVVLETACTVARSISGSLDLNETFRHIALSAARIMGDCRCLLLEAEAGDEERELVAVAGSDPADEVLLGLRIRFEDVPHEAEALLERKSIIVDDVVWGARTDAAYKERLGMRSALFVPITADQSLIGSLLLFSSGRRETYSPGDIARAETVAEQAASAIINARLYRDLAKSQERTSELLERITGLRQRSRMDLANVIHDDIVQTVVAALFELESLPEQLELESRDDLERVTGLLRQTITEARRVIWDLRPPALEGLGLHGALAALVDRLSREASAEIDLEIDDVPELDEGTQTALYLIAREALRNAHRHAGATHIRIRLGATTGSLEAAGQISLRVRDDGQGFDVAADRAEDHFGLTMMDEQATLTGGTLRVTSSSGKGTTVEVVSPIPLRGVGEP